LAISLQALIIFITHQLTSPTDQRTTLQSRIGALSKFPPILLLFLPQTRACSLSAFISDLGRRSPAHGSAFSFDTPHDQTVALAQNLAADKAAKDAQYAAGARAARAAKIAAEDMAAAEFEAAAAALQLAVDKEKLKLANVEPDDDAVASGQGIEASGAVNKLASIPVEGESVTLKVIKAARKQ